jgi:hypothetical protein
MIYKLKAAVLSWNVLYPMSLWLPCGLLGSAGPSTVTVIVFALVRSV